MGYSEETVNMIAEDMGVQFCYVTNSFDCPNGANCAECELSKEYEEEMKHFHYTKMFTIHDTGRVNNVNI